MVESSRVWPQTMAKELRDPCTRSCNAMRETGCLTQSHPSGNSTHLFCHPALIHNVPQPLLPLKHQSFWRTQNRSSGVQLEPRCLEWQQLTFFVCLFFIRALLFVFLLVRGRRGTLIVSYLDSSCPRVKLLKTPFLLVILMLLEGSGSSHFTWERWMTQSTGKV